MNNSTINNNPMFNFSIIASPVREHVSGKKVNAAPCGENALWLSIRSTTPGFSQVGLFADFIRNAWAIEETYFSNMQLAVSEAVKNAIHHGNKKDEEKSIHLSAKRYPEFYTFTIDDEGEGFDYSSVLPDANGNCRKATGRGIFLMQHFSESMRYSKEGKCVTLFFRRK